MFNVILVLAMTFSVQAQFPQELLPEYITLEHPSGERPDWEPTGSSKYIFVDKPGGTPFEKNIKTGEVHSIVPPNCEQCQVWRLHYLNNGDYVMTIGPGRGDATIQIISKDLDTPAWDMGEIAHEGLAISRHSLQIAWTNGPDIHVGTIVYGDDGVPSIENKRVVLNVDELKERDKSIPGEGLGATQYLDYHEPQDWIPPNDRILVFSRYGTSTTSKYSSETWTWNMDTDELINQSKRHAYYDEPEGIFPDGQHTLLESDMFLPVSQHAQILDLYRMRLDGTGKNMLRLTHFGNHKLPDSDVTFKANQGVISEDGKYMLFGEGRSNTQDQPGSGYGIYLFDFEAAGIKVNPGPRALKSSNE